MVRRLSRDKAFFSWPGVCLVIRRLSRDKAFFLVARRLSRGQGPGVCLVVRRLSRGKASIWW